jgi:hypothetical protein
MPRVFRVMKKDADGQPMVADDAGLGVRLNIDIRVDGPDDTFCFRLGDGAFASGHLANGLDLLVPLGKNPKHGGVRPEQVVPLAAFRADIEATRPDWVFDETP